MKNLSGHPDDRAISHELERASIEFVRLPRATGEVPSRLRGRLGPIEFTRAAVYWIAEGPVPLLLALDIDADPIGRHQVRVCGQAARPAPEPPWLRWYTRDGACVLATEHRATYAQMAQRVPAAVACMPPVVFNDEPTTLGASGYVPLYHIDSLDGLQVFTSTMRRHGLDQQGRPAWWITHHGAMAGGTIVPSAGQPSRAHDEQADSWEGETKDIEPTPGVAAPRKSSAHRRGDRPDNP